MIGPNGGTTGAVQTFTGPIRAVATTAARLNRQGFQLWPAVVATQPSAGPLPGAGIIIPPPAHANAAGVWAYERDWTGGGIAQSTTLNAHDNQWVSQGLNSDIAYSTAAGGFLTAGGVYVLYRYDGLAGSPADHESLALIRGPWDNYAGTAARGAGSTSYSFERWAGGAWAIDNASGFLASAGEPTPTSGERWWIRSQVTGTGLRMRAWRFGEAEPTSGLAAGAWLLDTTDTTFTTGNPGLRFGDGGAGGPVVIEAFATVGLTLATVRGLTAVVPITARITGTKGAAGAVRAPAPVTSRAVASKSAAGAGRAGVPVTGRLTGGKVAAGAARTVAVLTAQITGAAPVQRGLAAAVALTVRITGAKGAGGAVSASVPVSGRAAGAKGAVGAVTVSAAATVRAAGGKVAAGALRTGEGIVARITGASPAQRGMAAVVAITARITGAKGAGGSARAAVPVTGRAGGGKSATGAVRAATPLTARAAAAKAATGAVRTGESIVVRVTGTVGGAVIRGMAATVAVTARITGAKTATGAARVGTPTVAARITGAKSARGSLVVASVGPVVAGSGVKSVLGSVRGAVAVVVRTPSHAPVEAWSWFIRRAGAWLQATPRIGGTGDTTTDVG